MFSPYSETKEYAKSGSRKTKHIFLSFILLCILIFAGAVTYLVGPSATIVLNPNVSLKKIDLDIVGKSAANVNLSANEIPIRVFSEDQQISFTYDLSGQKVVSGQKAQGTVTIYNEYSDTPQTLIATTRLQTGDGKIFHIVKNVVVPGYTTSNGQIKPGTAQADIVADQAGEEYNIDSGDLNIPGFQGGPKYDKFHATLTQATKGGTTSDTQNGVGVVRQSDIDSAKQKAETQFKDLISNDIANQTKAGEIVLPQAENLLISKGASTAKVGDKVGSFNYNVQGSVAVLVFTENDIKALIQQAEKNDPQIKDATFEITKIDYGNLDPDFNNGAFDLKIHAELAITPKIDSVQVENALLGKSEDQLEDIIRRFPAIKNASVDFHPSFISHVPQYSQRVNIEIKADK